MEPKFIHLPEKKIVGMGAAFISALSPDKTNTPTIPKLWHSFENRQGEIRNKVEGASYGLIEMLPKNVRMHKDELFYVAGVEVMDFDAVPEEMLARTLPAGRYACFTHVGKLDRLVATMEFIYRTWVPKAGVELRPAPHVEVYDHRFDIGSDKSELDILLPVV